MDLTTLLNTSPDDDINGKADKNTTGRLNRGPAILDDGEVGESPFPIRDSPLGKAILRGTGDAKLPSRSRTPWDANGYTMPLINLEVESPTIPLLELQIDAASPKIPKHKVSDSYSSFSSLTSPSISSPSHSRLSSVSTAGDAQPIDTVPDLPSIEMGLGCHVYDGQGSQQLRRDGFYSAAIKEETFTRASSRLECSSRSPLIPRSLKDISPTRILANTSNTEAEPEFRHLVPLGFNAISIHKRNISAPDPARFSSLSRTPNPSNDASGLTTAAAYLGRQEPDRTIENPISWEYPTTMMPPQNGRSMKCEFVEDCNTGSTLRKTVSHVFGRNKLCTRMIPDHVWVHFCRKHYQRKRYRSIQQYALLQCKLVRVQICRVHDWSERERTNGNKPGVLQSWTLALRKREQERRQHSDINEEKDDDESPDCPVPSGTSVPSWLANQCGEGYSTDDILKIVDRIKDELDEKQKMNFPDIEILPDLILDGISDVSSRTKSVAHKRSQSLNSAVHVNKRQRSLDVVPSRNSLKYKPGEPLPHPMDPLAFSRHPNHHRMGGSASSHDTVGGKQYGYNGGPLPVPRPPRDSDFAMTMERGLSAPVPGGSTHHRSVSDLTGNFPQQNAEFTFRMNGPPTHNSFVPVSSYNYYPVLHEYVPIPPEPKPSHNYYTPSSNYSYYPTFPQGTPLPAEPKPGQNYSRLSPINGHRLNAAQSLAPPIRVNWPPSSDLSRSAEGSEPGHLRHQSTPS